MSNHCYEFISEVFNGENSVKVTLCCDKATSKKVMIKSFPKSNYDQAFFRHELEINRIVYGENIIKVLDYYETRTTYNLVMEAGSLDLFDYISTRGPLKEAEFMKLFKGIALAVENIHERKVLHNDLKLENIVMKGESLYLIDFGLSDVMTDNNNNNNCNLAAGTTFYTAPEIIKDNIKSEKSDIYSLGVVMFSMLTGEFPYDSDNSFIYTIQQLSNPPNIELLKDHHISKRVIDVISSCLDINPDQRPNMREIIKTLWPDDELDGNMVLNSLENQLF